MNISSLQNINNFLPTQKISNSVDGNSYNVIGNQDILSFSQILSDVSGNVTNVSDMFQTTFSNYNVQTKVGNCNVPWESWDRNDFPIWKYFQKNTSAECLNNWRGVGPEPPQWDSKVQQGLSQIGYGEMVILMPKSLQKKMETNPEFAEEVLKKVQKWKEDYDREDNAIAASLGYNPELNQLSKSYCIQLDENGNVGDHTVVGGGLDEPHPEESKEVKKDDEHNHITMKKVVKKGTSLQTNTIIEANDYSAEFEKVAPYLIELRMNKK